MSDQNNVQDSMHYKDCRSGMLTNGIERAAHREIGRASCRERVCLYV